MKTCKIAPSSCRHRYTTPCCKDCQEADCPVRCQNDPGICGCWADRPPRRKQKRKVDSLQAVWLHEQGLTQAEIAGQLGCCKNTVGTILREMGVSRFG